MPRSAFVLSLFLAIGAGASACMNADRARLPTAPAGQSSESASSATLPDRMTVIVIRRGTHTATPTKSPTIAWTSTRTWTPTRTPTETAAPIQTATATVPPSPTRTRTPKATSTRTPTSAPSIAISLRGIPWQWDFFSVPGQSDGGSSATLRRGQTYQLTIFNNAPADTNAHFFSGVAPLGISGGVLGPGDSFVVTFTPSSLGTFLFSCTDATCGVGHDNMLGSVTVIP